MLYLSRGRLCKETRGLVIRRFGVFRLTGLEAAIWLRGQNNFAHVNKQSETAALLRLVDQGIAVCESGSAGKARFMILSNFLFIPRKKVLFKLKGLEKTIMIWLNKSGFRISLAELVFLIDKNIEPTPNLLYAKNRLKLKSIIYPHTVTIYQQIENQMASSSQCIAVVNTLMHLVHMGYVGLI